MGINFSNILLGDVGVDLFCGKMLIVFLEV